MGDADLPHKACQGDMQAAGGIAHDQRAWVELTASKVPWLKLDSRYCDHCGWLA